MMELVDHPVSTSILKAGEEVFPIAAGEKYRAQKYVDGGIVDVLAEVTCPAGKQWSVRTIVEITETDA